MNGAAVFAAAVLAATLAAAAAARAAEPVAVFSGTGDERTAPFRVAPGWEVGWNADGRDFKLVLAGTEGGIPSIVADQIEPGGGVRNYILGGTYHFEIRARGSWRIEVRQR